MSETYDCIVIGVGGFGSGAFYHLAKRGLRVLGIEQFGIAHDRGSSHGETRIIRQAYFEHPNYVPLAIRAYELWRELEAESGRELMRLPGVVLAGPPTGEAVAGSKSSAEQHHLELEDLSPSEANTRFPGLQFPEHISVVYEPNAGYLFVENCVRTHIELAQQRGGVLRTDEAVVDWQSDGQTVWVQTTKQRYEAAAVILTAGAWSASQLKGLPLSLRILRKPVFWHKARNEFRDTVSNLPAFLFELPSGVFYGLPGTDGQTIKLSEHSGGDVVLEPGSVDRNLKPADQAKMIGFLETCVPAATLPSVRHNVCLYSMTADSHFVIDRHPRWNNVVFGAGFSGHGFKFTGVLGEGLADLVMQEPSTLPMEFLSLSRDTLTKKQ